MRTLAIETATEACSVALFETGDAGQQCLAHEHRVLGRGHAEALIPMIAALPQKGKADRIVVSLGPGSFTGVRIGIASARALGFAWGAQVFGYSTLALIAAQAQENAPMPVTVCINGGHGEWFVQNFNAGGEAEGAVQSLPPNVIAQLHIHPIIAGNRAEDCARLLPSKHTREDLLPSAQKTKLLGKNSLTKDLAPIYGRAPDAKPQNSRSAAKTVPQ